MAAVAPNRRQQTRRDLGLEQLLAVRHARERRLRRRHRSVLSILALLVAAIVVLSATAAVLTGPAILSSFCSLNDLRPLSLGSNSFLYSANGRLLGVVPSATNRQPLPLSKMSPWLPEATVAIEDARFWQHGALDYHGIIRAFWDDVTKGQIVQGGSTLTQQLVRNLYIGNQQKTFSRKLKEACLADKLFTRMQARYGSNARKQLLAAYLNEVFYGRHAYGVEAASETYFSKNASKLNLSEAALIAGLPQAPTTYDPLVNPQFALARRDEVLQAMFKNGYITRWEFRTARSKRLGLKPGHLYTTLQQPNFFGWATQQLAERYGQRQVERGGLRVRTTLDPRLQALALHAAESVLHTSTDPATAIVAIDPSTGAVKAMVDYLPNGKHLQFNLATQAHRSTGSAFKPITLATVLDEGGSLNSSFYGPPELLDHRPAVPDEQRPMGRAQLRRRVRRDDEPHRRDRGLHQHDLRPTRREGRSVASRADGALVGDHEHRPRFPARLCDHARLGRLHAARAHRRLRDDRSERSPPHAAGVPGCAGAEHEGARQDLHRRPRRAGTEP